MQIEVNSTTITLCDQPACATDKPKPTCSNQLLDDLHKGSTRSSLRDKKCKTGADLLFIVGYVFAYILKFSFAIILRTEISNLVEDISYRQQHQLHAHIHVRLEAPANYKTDYVCRSTLQWRHTRLNQRHAHELKVCSVL